MKETKSILIVGVGGQGTLLASRVMGRVFAQAGFDVKVSEVHGMSQRGGSVVTYVRYGETVWSGLIEKGEADLVLSFEELEAARWLPYLKKGGVLITSTERIEPMPVILGNAQYPQNIADQLRRKAGRAVVVDAPALAAAAGSAKSVNVVLLGVAARFLGLSEKLWREAIRATVPPGTIEVNERAFELGYQNGGIGC